MPERYRQALFAILTFGAGLFAGFLIVVAVLRPAMSTSEATSRAGIGTSEAQAISANESVNDGSDEVNSTLLRVSNEIDDDSHVVSASGSQPEAGLDVLLARIDVLNEGWGRIQTELAELRQRLDLMERRSVQRSEQESPEQQQSMRPLTPQEQRSALVRAGVTAGQAEDIVWRRAQLALDRLELRDQAAREGWLDTPRYQEELQAINEQRVSLRDELEVDSYDRYLYETGQNNRVSVDSLIPGSTGEASGIQPGDIIESYGQEPVFDFGDLRSATTEGERGELVPMVVRRGNRQVELWLPRGPIGVQLEATRLDPRG